MPLAEKTAYNDESDLMKIDPIPYSDKPRSKFIKLIYLYFSYYCSENYSKRSYAKRQN